MVQIASELRRKEKSFLGFLEAAVTKKNRSFLRNGSAFCPGRWLYLSEIISWNTGCFCLGLDAEIFSEKKCIFR